MSKVLQASANVWMTSSERYERLNEDALEQMREHGELLLHRSDRKLQVTGAFEQAIASKLLNQKYEKSYPVADFNETGEIYMRDRESVSKMERALPDVKMPENDVQDGLLF